MIELLLGLLAMQEFEIINQQQVDAAEPVYERESILAMQSINEFIPETLCSEIKDLRVRHAATHFPCNCLQ